MAVKQEFPNNGPLTKAIQKRLISLADLTPEEAQEIEAFEAKKIVEGVTGPQLPGGSPTGAPQATPEGIDQLIANSGINVKV
jgi:hypothetical protein